MFIMAFRLLILVASIECKEIHNQPHSNIFEDNESSIFEDYGNVEIVEIDNALSGTEDKKLEKNTEIPESMIEKYPKDLNKLLGEMPDKSIEVDNEKDMHVKKSPSMGTESVNKKDTPVMEAKHFKLPPFLNMYSPVIDIESRANLQSKFKVEILDDLSTSVKELMAEIKAKDVLEPITELKQSDSVQEHILELKALTIDKEQLFNIQDSINPFVRLTMPDIIEENLANMVIPDTAQVLDRMRNLYNVIAIRVDLDTIPEVTEWEMPKVLKDVLTNSVTAEAVASVLTNEEVQDAVHNLVKKVVLDDITEFMRNVVEPDAFKAVLSNIAMPDVNEVLNNMVMPNVIQNLLARVKVSDAAEALDGMDVLTAKEVLARMQVAVKGIVAKVAMPLAIPEILARVRGSLSDSNLVRGTMTNIFNDIFTKTQELIATSVAYPTGQEARAKVQAVATVQEAMSEVQATSVHEAMTDVQAAFEVLEAMAELGDESAVQETITELQAVSAVLNALPEVQAASPVQEAMAKVQAAATAIVQEVMAKMEDDASAIVQEVMAQATNTVQEAMTEVQAAAALKEAMTKGQDAATVQETLAEVISAFVKAANSEVEATSNVQETDITEVNLLFTNDNEEFISQPENQGPKDLQEGMEKVEDFVRFMTLGIHSSPGSPIITLTSITDEDLDLNKFNTEKEDKAFESVKPRHKMSKTLNAYDFLMKEVVATKAVENLDNFEPIDPEMLSRLQPQKSEIPISMEPVKAELSANIVPDMPLIVEPLESITPATEMSARMGPLGPEFVAGLVPMQSEMPTSMEPMQPEVPAGMEPVVPEMPTGMEPVVPEMPTGMEPVVPEMPTGIEPFVPEMPASMEKLTPEMPVDMKHTQPEILINMETEMPTSIEPVEHEIFPVHLKMSTIDSMQPEMPVIESSEPDSPLQVITDMNNSDFFIEMEIGNMVNIEDSNEKTKMLKPIGDVSFNKIIEVSNWDGVVTRLRLPPNFQGLPEDGPVLMEHLLNVDDSEAGVNESPIVTMPGDGKVSLACVGGELCKSCARFSLLRSGYALCCHRCGVYPIISPQGYTDYKCDCLYPLH